uniref:USP domain-containing protein n=1 Tax=Meloidogyne enterolobii TaxID=390850 RepID=A0A6V7WP27_MELEN|nr:unnamed protein product [Meloidogyne enterolobii]
MKILVTILLNEELLSSPEIVIIKLDRPKAEVKDTRNVNLIENFDFSQYMHERSNYYQTNYNLYSMVIHIGSLEHGHYVAVLKQSNKWLLYNDDERRTEINIHDPSFLNNVG